MLSDDDKEFRTAKGVHVAMELKNMKTIRHKMKRIHSKKHKIGTYEVNKISLWCFDDKRFVLDDCIYTLAYFIKTLKK